MCMCNAGRNPEGAECAARVHSRRSTCSCASCPCACRREAAAACAQCWIADWSDRSRPSRARSNGRYRPRHSRRESPLRPQQCDSPGPHLRTDSRRLALFTYAFCTDRAGKWGKRCNLGARSRRKNKVWNMQKKNQFLEM